MFDTVHDVTASGTREVQVKCLGKSLSEYNVGDAVTLYVGITGDEIGALQAQVDAGEHDIVDICGTELSFPLDPAFGILMNGRPSDMTDYQIAVHDGSFLSVTNGILTGTHDERNENLPAVDNWGLPFDGDITSGAWT